MNESELKVLSDIEQYGLHIIHILGEKELPPYSFSIGLFKSYNHPEIIFIGMDQQLSHSLINNIASDIKNGEKFEANKYYPDIIERFDCYFVDVNKLNYKEYLGYANWYYEGYDYPVVQCIYPTTNGIYPWQSEWPENIKNLQPVLSQ